MQIKALVSITLLVAILLPLAAHAGPTQEFLAANKRMHEGMHITYTGHVESDFTRGMIPHHQGAVDMAKVSLLKYGKDPEIRKLAEWIIYIQQIEIGWMNHWLTRRAKPAGVRAVGYDSEAVAEFTEQMHWMHREMDIDFTGNADVDMVRGMIPHHQAAIDMAYTLLQHGEDPDLKELAHGIITSQNSEIAMMKRWLKSRHGETVGITGEFKTCDSTHGGCKGCCDDGACCCCKSDEPCAEDKNCCASEECCCKVNKHKCCNKHKSKHHAHH